MYFFRREKIQCRYQFSLRDAVDITLLQRALTTALASAPYYTQRLVQEKHRGQVQIVHQDAAFAHILR